VAFEKTLNLAAALAALWARSFVVTSFGICDESRQPHTFYMELGCTQASFSLILQMGNDDAFES
jgi:hypothetical protein